MALTPCLKEISTNLTNMHVKHLILLQKHLRVCVEVVENYSTLKRI